MTRGRPPHEPTPKSRQRVAVVAGAGWNREEIAELLGIDADTLAKHYKHDLTVGAREMREEIIEVMRKSAKKGNVAAGRLYLTGSSRAPTPAPVTDQSLEIVSMPSQATGVKAQRNEQAKVAQQGTEWATLLPSSVQ